ncbi:retrovirus-related pol polyprotein from transposon TNT 1-94, partial [Tanacetum coccineum]
MLAKSVKNSDLNAQLQEKVFAIAALKNELSKLKGKNVVNTMVSKPTTTLASEMFKLDIEPISPRLKNNRDAHEVYIEKTIEYANTLCGFVECARIQYPSEPLLESACVFTKHVQELLVYASQTCPNSPKPSSRDTYLYTISLDDVLKASPICLLSKSSKTKSWLWHRPLSHLNFACALGKIKKSSHQTKVEDTNQEKLYLLHMDLCGPMRVESINKNKYILVIVDDYSQFTWVKFLRSKDEAPDAIIKCIKNIQVSLNATIRNVRTDNGTEFVNQTLRDFYENVSISHQTLVARTPQQNGIVERRNQTLVEVARTMLIFSKAPLEDLGKLNAKADIGHRLQVLTLATSSSGLVPNIIPQQPFLVAAAPRAVEIADSLVSTSIDQDAPSSSIPSTQDQEHYLIISQGVEESPKTPLFHDDPLQEALHEDLTSQGSSSN